MTEPNITALRDLLRQAGAAHGEYETTVLNGVYDEAWPTWYAEWLLTHGFNELVHGSHSGSELAVLLSDLNQQYRASGSTQHWADFYAERIRL
jgi:hypothetical protein